MAGSYATTVTYTAIGNEPAPVLTGITITGAYAQNGTPTPDNPVAVEVVEDEVGLSVAGKNLSNPNELISDGTTIFGTVNTDGSITGALDFDDRPWSYDNCQEFITLPAGTYTISWGASGRATYSSVRIYNPEDTILYQVWSSTATSGYGSFTLDAETTIGIMTKIYQDTWWFQLETGDTKTDYESYIGTSSTIDLQGNFLGALPNGVADTIDIDMKGNVVLTKRVGYWKSTGLESLSGPVSLGTYNRYGITQSLAEHPSTGYVYGTDGRAVSNWYGSSVDYWERDSLHFYAVNATLIIFSTISTQNDLIAKLTNDPLEIYYELATPYTINLGKINLPSRDSTVNAWSVSSPATTTTLNYI